VAGAAAPESLKRLVDRFDQDRKAFLSPDCKEEQLRVPTSAHDAGDLSVRGSGDAPGAPPLQSESISSHTRPLDTSGRRVLELHAGVNDVRALAPGVYFVHEAETRAQAHVVRKVVITQ
jgi:hypothetical protein